MLSLDAIRERLHDPDEETRHTAVHSLGQYGEEALPVLEEALGDQSWRVRKASLELVVGLPGEATNEILLRGLRDESNAGRRNSCVEALIRFGGVIIPFLDRLLEDDDPDIRKFGVDILGNIDDMRVFAPLLKALEDREDNVSAAAAEFVGKKKHRPAVQPLIDRLQRGDFWVKYSCIQALGEIGESAAGPVIIEFSAQNDLRKVCLEALGKIGDPDAVPALLEGLFSGNRGLRKVALLAVARVYRKAVNQGASIDDLLGGIKEDAGPETTLFLQEMLQRDDAEVRSAAIIVLGAAAGAKAVNPLLSVMTRLGEDEQALVAEVLGRLPQEDMQHLVPKLHDEEPMVRRWLTRVVGQRKVNDAVPHLVNLLRDDNGHVRNEAARALGTIGNKVAVAPLLALLSDPYPDVRQSGVEALIHMGLTGEEERRLVIDFLEAPLNSPDQEVVANALKVVGRLGRADVVERLSFTLKDERSQVRQAAVEALGLISGAGAVSLLRLALTDEDPVVRRAAVQSLGMIGGEEIKPLVAPMLQDDDLWVRVRAVQSLAGIDSPEAHAVILELAEQGKPGPEKLAAIRALGESKISGSLGALMSLVKSPDREGRMAAIEALGKLQQDEAVDILLSCLEDDDWSLRVAAVKSLGAFDGGDRVRTALTELSRTDPDPLVRKAAEEFLGSDGKSA